MYVTKMGVVSSGVHTGASLSLQGKATGFRHKTKHLNRSPFKVLHVGEPRLLILSRGLKGTPTTTPIRYVTIAIVQIMPLGDNPENSLGRPNQRMSGEARLIRARCTRGLAGGASP